MTLLNVTPKSNHLVLLTSTTTTTTTTSSTTHPTTTRTWRTTKRVNCRRRQQLQGAKKKYIFFIAFYYFFLTTFFRYYLTMSIAASADCHITDDLPPSTPSPGKTTMLLERQTTLLDGLESVSAALRCATHFISVLPVHRTAAASLSSKHLSACAKQDFGSRKLQHQRYLPSSSSAITNS